MRALTTIGITEATQKKINLIKIKFGAKTKEDVISALLNSYDKDKLKQIIQSKKEVKN